MRNGTMTGWMPEPNSRGTYGLLTSCLITLTLCVYTALHLNVFSRNATPFQIFATKAKWVLMGMFAPELVVYAAWCQRDSAKSLTLAVNKEFRQQAEKDPQMKRKHAWTLIHSYYALMGGYAFDTDNDGEQPYIPGSPRLLLTTHGVLETVKLGVLPDISKEHIQDKSKKDGIAKALAIMQAGWLIIQCIERWAAHLTVTPLEVNTLAHAVCALIMYMLWWDKPLDVCDSTPISNESARPICAWMWMSSSVSARVRARRKILRDILSIAELFELCWLKEKSPQRGSGIERASDPNSSAEGRSALTETGSAQRQSKDNQGPTSARLENHMVTNSEPSTMDSITILNYRTNASSGRLLTKRAGESENVANVEIFQGEVVKSMGIGYYYPQGGNYQKLSILPPRSFFVDAVTLQRWSLLVQFFREVAINEDKSSHRSLGFSPRVMRESPKYTLYTFRTGHCNLVDVESHNWPRSAYMDYSQKWSEAVFIISAVAYGGIHIAIAWSEEFPSSLEQLLWKISASYIIVLGVSVVLIEHFFNMILGFWDTFLEDSYNCYVPRPIDAVLRALLSMGKGFLYALFGSGLVFYFFTRIFLVAEAFVSLRGLPVDAYNTPSLTQFLPHI